MSTTTASAPSKVVRPDRNEFNKKMDDLKQHLTVHQATLNKAKASIEKKGTKPQDPEWNKLLEELKGTTKERDALKSGIQGKYSEVKAVEAEVQKKLKDVLSLRPKNSAAKNEQELNAKIKSLESLVDSGTLALVEEKKTIKEITALKNARKQFAQVTKLQSEIDADRAKIAEMRKNIDDSELKAANSRVQAINKSLDARKEARQAERKDLDAVYNERRAAQAEIKKIHAELDLTRDDFNKKLNAFRDHIKEQKKQREDEERAEKAAAARAKKVSQAKEKVAQAQVPAFGAQITKAEALLAYFDPSFKSSDDGAKAAGSAGSELASGRSAPRQVESLPEGAKLIKKAGPGAEASRKVQKRRGTPAAAGAAAGATPNAAGNKLKLDLSIIDDLAELKISLPASVEDVEGTKKALLEKIDYYKQNNERVTKERVERAEADLAKVEAAASEEPEAEKAE